MADLSRFVIGTAAWGPRPYGGRGQTVSNIIARKIAQQAIDWGVSGFANKAAYDVAEGLLDFIRETGTPIYRSNLVRNTYGLHRATLAGHDLPVCVEFNPLRQFIARSLARMRSGVWVRSIWMQGVLAGPIPQEWIRHLHPLFDCMRNQYHTVYEVCVWLALTLPGIDRIVVGVNSMDELERLADTITKLPSMFDPEDYVSACLGDSPITDPRNLSCSNP